MSITIKTMVFYAQRILNFETHKR